MTPFDKLSPQEIEKAISLATELHEKERLGREPGGETPEPPSLRATASDSLPFLAQAVQMVRTTRAETAEKGFQRSSLLLGGLILLLVVFDVAFVLPRLAPAPVVVPYTAAVPKSESAATDNTPLVVTLPPPPVRILSGIPVPADYKLDITPYDSGWPTSITFVNQMKQAAYVENVGARGRNKTLCRLKPGESYRSYRQFGQPVIVRDTSKRILGLYYPTGFSMKADITGPSRVQRSADLKGYLPSVHQEEVTAQVRTKPSEPGHSQSPTGITSVPIALLNMRRETVNLYNINPNGSASFIHAIIPGKVWLGYSQFNARSVVMDKRKKILGVYKSPPVASVAVLLPE